MKTIGQIAYEAYCEAVGWQSFKADPLPQWPEVKERIKEAWEAAAEAVLANSPSHS